MSAGGAPRGWWWSNRRFELSYFHGNFANPEEEYFDCSNQDVGIEEMCSLMLEIAEVDKVTFLNISGNLKSEETILANNMDAFLHAFETGLLANRSLRSLDLSNNRLFVCMPQSYSNIHVKDYFVLLTNILTKSNIVNIDISDNYVIGRGQQHYTGFTNFIRSFLVEKGEVKSLICRQNRLSSLSFHALSLAFGAGSSLTYLDLSDNLGGLSNDNEINCSGVEMLCTQLSLNFKLRFLRLARNHLCDDHFCHVAHCIQFAKTLVYLDLSGNLCRKKGMEALKDAIISIIPTFPDENNSGLLELDMSDNPLESGGSFCLHQIVRAPATIDTLRVSRCGIDSASMRSIVSALERNIHLKSFSYDGNDFEVMLGKRVDAELQINRLLPSLISEDANYCNADGLSPAVYSCLVRKLRFLPEETLRKLYDNPSFTVEESALFVTLSRLAPLDRHNLVTKLHREDPTIIDRVSDVKHQENRITAAIRVYGFVSKFLLRRHRVRLLRETLSRIEAGEAILKVVGAREGCIDTRYEKLDTSVRLSFRS